MTDLDFNASVTRLRELEKIIQSAEIEVRIREERLAELRPKREVLESRATTEFDCAIRDLPARIIQAEENFKKEVEKLDAAVTKAEAL